jgi:hypothetical protein
LPALTVILIVGNLVHFEWLGRFSEESAFNRNKRNFVLIKIRRERQAAYEISNIDR